MYTSIIARYVQVHLHDLNIFGSEPGITRIDTDLIKKIEKIKQNVPYEFTEKEVKRIDNIFAKGDARYKRMQNKNNI